MSDRVARMTDVLISRRHFIQGTAAAGVTVFLAACSGGASATNTPGPSAAASAAAASAAAASAAPSPSPSPAPATPKVVTGPLKWANWPAYIDLTGQAAANQKYAAGSSPTIVDFEKQYNVQVDYEEKIEENNSFFATIQPQLVTGLPTGWDLIVMTDWMAGRLIGLNWLEKIDQGNVPNCVANLRDPLKGYPWDPNNDYHYPWQSGMTGIGYDSTSLKNAKLPVPTKIADLWTLPSDKVTFLTEARDTFGLGLLKLGLPADSAQTTADNLQAVHDDIAPLVAKGLRFVGNEYLQDFASKKTWAAFVWSGDLANSGSPDQHFVFPEEGNMVWSDNMLIPKGATNKYTAELMMNWVYDPKIAAQIANYVYYVSPVKGVEAIVKQLNASSPIPAEKLPLLFPTADIVAKQHNFESLSSDVEKSLNSLYTDLSGA